MNKRVSIEFLINKYQETSSDDIFYEIYSQVTKKWKHLVKRLSTRYYIGEDEVESMMHYKLFEVVKNHDSSKGEFANNLSTAIKRGCIDLVRRKTLTDQESLMHAKYDDDGNEVDQLELLATANAEEEIVENIQKNSEQKNLLATLIGLADEATRQSVSAYAETFSFREAAKQLGGTTDKTVKKRIRKLSLKYDKKKFGEITDYFTAPTVKIAN